MATSTKSQFVRDYLTKNPDATAEQITVAADKQDLVVSAGLVYVTRSQLRRKGLLPTPPPRSVEGKAVFVAKYLQQHPKATPMEIVDAAAAEGLSMSAGSVYYVKLKQKVQKSRERAREQRGLRAVAVAAKPAGSTVDAEAAVVRRDMVEMVALLQELARTAGGKEKLKQLIDLVVR